MAKASSQMDDIAFLICWMESRKVYTAGNWRKRIGCQREKDAFGKRKIDSIRVSDAKEFFLKQQEWEREKPSRKNK